MQPRTPKGGLGMWLFVYSGVDVGSIASSRVLIRKKLTALLVRKLRRHSREQELVTCDRTGRIRVALRNRTSSKIGIFGGFLRKPHETRKSGNRVHRGQASEDLGLAGLISAS